MSDDFIDPHKERARLKVEEEFRRYAALCRKGALGKLSKAEEAEFDRLIVPPVRTWDTAKADADIFREQYRLKNIADGLDCSRAAQQTILDERAAINRELSEFEQGIKARLKAIAPRVSAAARAVEAAKAAKDSLDKLNAEHWQLLGHANPADLAGRRHVWQGVFAEAPKGDYSVVSVEQVMDSPAAFQDLLTAKRENFFPLPGQSDVDRLFALVVGLARGGRTAKYLLHKKDFERARNVTLLLPVEVQILHLHLYDPKAKTCAYELVPAPGTTAEEFEEMKTQLFKNFAKAQAQSRGDEELRRVNSRSGAVEYMGR